MSDDTADIFSDRGDTTGSFPPEMGSIPSRVGRYRVLEPLGEGGFGVVYRAEQTEPVTRRVALKVIKLGMDSKAVVARFQAERQALAVMAHPCVATVLDGGLTESGRPWFAMELVKGLPITEHCDRHKLGLDDRLKLFIRVCEAVQHAHSKGVIHRDLKPSNILVEYSDGESVPKVIDFGVAKALSQRLTEATVFTEQGQLIGTPEYMSPEQAEMSAQDIDTRADVYSLGVLLYELLTGSPPFESKTLRSGGFAEVQRIIRDVEPPKPSTRLVSMQTGDDPSTAARIAETRRTEVRSLAGTLKRDLDWVAMKCLEKDRERRYDTANALAMELRRYIDGQPVLAGPPSATYRLGKFVRRNKAGVVAAALVGAALLAGLVGTSAGLVEANRQRGAAVRSAGEAVAARERAEDAEQRAQRRADELQIVADFQAEQLGAVDAAAMGLGLRGELVAEFAARLERGGAGPDDARRRADELDASLSGVDFTGIALGSLETHVFAPALDAIDRQFGDQPLVAAQLLQTLAAVLREAGLLEAAEAPQRAALETRRRVLGDDHPDTLLSVNNMGFLLQSQGRLDEAEPHYRESLDGFRRVLGDEHPDTLSSVNNMGSLLQSQGRLDEAEPYYREALDDQRRVLGDEYPGTLTSVNNLGFLLQAQGRLDEAEPYYREALDARRRVLGDEHPSTLLSVNNMGFLLQAQGRLDEAEPYYREALDARRRVLGDDHPRTLQSVNNVGMLLLAQGRLDKAERYLREALDGQRRVLGDDHPNTLGIASNLALLLADLGRGEAALELADEAVETGRRVLGDEHWFVGNFLGKRGRALEELGRFADAAAAMEEGYTILAAALGSEHAHTRRVAGYLADLHDAWHAAEPGNGYDATATEWREKLEQLEPDARDD